MGEREGYAKAHEPWLAQQIDNALEERLRVNVGLIAENKELRKQLAEKEGH